MTPPVTDLQTPEPARVAHSTVVRTPAEGLQTACSSAEGRPDGVGWNQREVGSLGGIPTTVSIFGLEDKLRSRLIVSWYGTMGACN
ncbi:hypothetical protein BN13_390032 [Nostocoides jenkinsii Ben 74]|uniref:Uncharacterized protein n=1 Tax=Nostocoides jenkinsii Ben 74 TaxID=1193518 RepID=A0A077MC46_9MICO|nr:hypothetical protein BN13_390032 [Tetrasphaera jenkinsii Ben 74]